MNLSGVPRAKLTHAIIGAAIEVHRTLGGPGLLERVYEEAFAHELGLRGLDIRLDAYQAFLAVR